MSHSLRCQKCLSVLFVFC